MTRVIAYVDGFNLYHGLKAKHGRKYHWLDVQALTTSLLRPGQHLTRLEYFTARIRNQPASEQRQEQYLSAVSACCPTVRVVEGRFQERTSTCLVCGTARTLYEEKETDVNLALAMARDATLDLFDTALLISADSDLCPAIRLIRELAPEKQDDGRTCCVVPRTRHSPLVTPRYGRPSCQTESYCPPAS